MDKTETTLLLELADESLADVNVLFQEPSSGNEVTFLKFPGRDWVIQYARTLRAIRRDLTTLARDPESAVRWVRAIDDGADSLDELNALVGLSNGKGFAPNFEQALFGALAERGIGGDTLSDVGAPEAVDARFFFQHGIRAAGNLRLLRRYVNELKRQAPEGLARLRPDWLRLTETPTLFTGDSSLTAIGGVPITQIGRMLDEYDRFGGGRAFRYLHDRFVPVATDEIRPVEQFFGYNGIRKAFEEHFTRFSAGHRSEPLLISSLPGLGKTQFTMAFTLSCATLTLVLAGPEDLESGLEKLLAELGQYKRHRFVVFFDDIDPRTLDWYLFRTNIGGSLTMPENVLIVLAANYEFPASILSRGRGITFPTFDEIRCEEMIEDFLKFKGLHTPSQELVSVIAADYTEEFGQKKFPELSPRTLMRYLNWYETDPRKRKRLLDQSKMELIVRPDAQLFYEFNLKQLKMLYGDDKVTEAVQAQLSKGAAAR